MIHIGEYYGEEQYQGYIAKVFIEDEVPTVEFWKDGQFVAVRAFPDNSVCYAEDAAENYVMGILKL